MNKRKALVVTARGGFIKGFLLHDLMLLQDQGYEVHCCANDNGKGYIEDLLRERGVQFHQVDFASKTPLNKDNLRSAKQLKKVIREIKPELIHCHTAIASAITRAVLLFRNRKKTRLIYTTHGLSFHKQASRKAWLLYYTMEKLLSLFTDTIITINQEDFGNAKRMFCRDVRYIHGVGVNLKRYDLKEFDRSAYRESLGISEDELFVLSVGELSQRKNHQVIIKAIRQAKLKNVVYGIAGAGIPGSSTYDSLLALASREGVKLKLFGFRNDIPQLCHCADIGAIPSNQEGLGLAGIEQLRCGVPVLGADVQGIRDYITDGKNGYLYGPYDVQGFAEGLVRLQDKSARDAMRDFCISATEKFDISVSYKEMENIYKDVANKL